jgi:DNA-binding response OmpR family regulator
MNGLGQHVVDAGFQQFDGLLERAQIGERDDRCAGLLADDARAFRQAGIDDVLPKPVHVREILARSEAIWRRVNGAVQPSEAEGETEGEARGPDR